MTYGKNTKYRGSYGSTHAQSVGHFSGYYNAQEIGLPPPPVRLMTIEFSGLSAYGYREGVFGALDLTWWGMDDSGETVAQIVADVNTDEFILSEAVVGGNQWNGVTTIIVTLEGWGSIELVWDAIDSRYEVVDAALVTYVVGQVGNQLEVTIDG